MRFFLLILLFFISSEQASLEAQDRALKRNAESFTKAIIEEDFDQLIQLSYENLIEMSGGTFYLREEFQKDAQMRKEQNMKLLSVECFYNNKKVMVQGELQTIVDLEYTIVFNGNKYKNYSALYASSTDRGTNWKFIDLQKHNAESLKLFVPSFSEELDFPVLKEAILLEKN